jgi:hypothetical protein
MSQYKAFTGEENAAEWRYILKAYLSFMYINELSGTSGIPSRLASEPVCQYSFISKLYVTIVSFIATVFRHVNSVIVSSVYISGIITRTDVYEANSYFN